MIKRLIGGLLLPSLAAANCRPFCTMLARASRSGAAIHWGLFALGLVVCVWQVSQWWQGRQSAWRYAVIVLLASGITLELYCAVL